MVAGAGCAGSSVPNAGWKNLADDERFAKAVELQETGRLEAARFAFRRLRQEQPDHVAAFLHEVDLTRGTEAAPELAAELDALVEAARSPAGRSRYLALEARLEESVVTREEILNEAIALDPENAIAHASLAEVFEKRGAHERALLHWRQAVAGPLAPPFAYLGLARAAVRHHDPRTAIDALEVYVALEPERTSQLYNLGTLLLDEARAPDAAFKYLIRAHELDRTNMDYTLNAASAAVLSGRVEEGRDLLDWAATLDPEDASVQFNLAVLYADHLGQPDRAIHHFERYLELGGEDELRVRNWLERLRGDE